jgi:hypothetical protein
MQAVQAPSNATNTNGHGPSSSTPDQVLRLALQITASIATSLQEALEHGSKNEKEFEGFDDPIEDAHGEDVKMGEDDSSIKDDEDEDSDEMTQEEIEADMKLVTGDDDVEDDSPIEEVTLDHLVRNAAPVVLSLATPQDPQTPTQSAALSALNNIAWTIGSIDFSTGHLKSLQRFWTTLTEQIWNEIVSPVLASNTADIELASATTSLAWAVARSVKGSIPLKPEEHIKFMSLYQASKGLNGSAAADAGSKPKEDEDDAFQSLSVKCIGVLGCLAQDPAPVDLNREIGVFLVTVLETLPDVPPADTVEVLNQIFDIYADKSFDFDEPVFWGHDLYKHLESIQPKAKKLAKSIDKRKHEELRARADEAVLNLGRFLVYKRKERAGK